MPTSENKEKVHFDPAEWYWAKKLDISPHQLKEALQKSRNQRIHFVKKILDTKKESHGGN